MERVVYLLGAGFSAPLGLPVMNDVLVKSRDLYFSNREMYPHFDEVFQMIAQLSVTKNYFETDLFNIEEILSILGTESYAAAGRVIAPIVLANFFLAWANLMDAGFYIKRQTRLKPAIAAASMMRRSRSMNS